MRFEVGKLSSVFPSDGDPGGEIAVGSGTVGHRLRISSRIFSFFVKMRAKSGLDVESIQIISAFNLAGLAEQQRAHGPTSGFCPDTFMARLSATTLSEMTRIPRQTVRRRLQTLETLGYLTPANDGSYEMTVYRPDVDIVEEITSLTVAGHPYI